MVVTASDVILQLMICFVCLTMGSHEHLRKFIMTVDLSLGVPKIVLTRIQSKSLRISMPIDQDSSRDGTLT